MGDVSPRQIRKAASLKMRRAHEQGQQTMFVPGPDGTLQILDNDWASVLAPGDPTRMCRCCGRILPECCFFRSHSRHGSMARFHPDCVICEYERREAWRHEHVFEEAARTRLGDHMRRERDQRLHRYRTLAEYELLTGVTVAWLAELMRDAWERNAHCHHCDSAGRVAEWQSICPVIEGIPDLSRMTIDRTDPSRLLARDNLTLMCLIGNIAKNDTDPRTNAIRNAYWRLHNAAAKRGDNAA
jgi:hypothetical protein